MLYLLIKNMKAFNLKAKFLSYIYKLMPFRRDSMIFSLIFKYKHNSI